LWNAACELMPCELQLLEGRIVSVEVVGQGSIEEQIWP
jgi:hypothetical protein